jgi:hypothetical protein
MLMLCRALELSDFARPKTRQAFTSYLFGALHAFLTVMFTWQDKRFLAAWLAPLVFCAAMVGAAIAMGSGQDSIGAGVLALLALCIAMFAWMAGMIYPGIRLALWEMYFLQYGMGAKDALGKSWEG